jgi:broad specificity phosphatase PhoE
VSPKKNPNKKSRKRPQRATKIMLIRHAEKPAKDSEPYGVTAEGDRNKESLEVRGWQRAGALANLLAPANGHFQHASLAKPKFLFASKPLRRKGSRRPIETLTPLAEKLELKINSSFQRSDFESMIDEVVSCKGVVLICWQREYIPDIAAHILGKKKIAPSNWPEDCFDVIWVFDLARSSSKYTFKQVPQKLLGGDLTTPIK